MPSSVIFCENKVGENWAPGCTWIWSHVLFHTKVFRTQQGVSLGGVRTPQHIWYLSLSMDFVNLCNQFLVRRDVPHVWRLCVDDDLVFRHGGALFSS